MRRMFKISIPRDLSPVFPDACLGCAVDRPGEHTRFFHFNGTSFFAVRIPVCQRCRRRVRTWLLWDNLRTLLIGGLSLSIGIFVLLPRLPGWATGLIVLGLCCFGFAAVFLWNRLYPPAFNLDAGSHMVDYEFRDDDLGRRFATLNGGAPRSA